MSIYSVVKATSVALMLCVTAQLNAAPKTATPQQSQLLKHRIAANETPATVAVKTNRVIELVPSQQCQTAALCWKYREYSNGVFQALSTPIQGFQPEPRRRYILDVKMESTESPQQMPIVKMTLNSIVASSGIIVPMVKTK